MPCRPSRSVRPPPRPQGVFDLTQARLATNFRRRSIPPRVILYEPRTPDLTQSHECKHTWDSRVGVWHGVLTSCGGLTPATSRRSTLLHLGCVLLRLGTLLLPLLEHFIPSSHYESHQPLGDRWFRSNVNN